jgi:N-acetyl-S-(2-succino)cysteine monooxygenase
VPEQRRQLHFGISAGGGGLHHGAWRRPDSRSEEFPSVTLLKDLAITAERGRFDTFFLADGVALDRQLIRHNLPFGHVEPVSVLSAISSVTTSIGLIATASTTFSEPYNVARQFATLDHVSGGRAGWNIVTSSTGEQNFGGKPLPSHSERYARAHEFVDVVLKLWDSWEDDAHVNDRAGGTFADPEKVHEINHVGPAFRVRGPLNVPRTPQGRPVLVQAGSSEDGKNLAAAYADLIFTAQRDLVKGQEFYRDLKSRAARFGRDPDSIFILPGLVPIVGETETEAKRIHDELLGYADTRAGIRRLEQQLDGVDLSGYTLDDRIPPEVLPAIEDVQGRQSRYAMYHDLIVREKWTIRQLMSLEVSANGHLFVVGDPEQVANDIVERFEARSADGYNVIPPYVPTGFVGFVDQVIPLLQQRGLFRTEYEADTLHGLFGLARPANRYAPAPAGSVRRFTQRVAP